MKVFTFFVKFLLNLFFCLKNNIYIYRKFKIMFNMFRRTLRDIIFFLGTIEDINNGGCGIAALALYKWLEKHENYKPEILFCYRADSRDRLKTNKSIMEEDKNNVRTSMLKVPNHIMVKYHEDYIDADGFWPDAQFYNRYEAWHTVSVEQLISTIHNYRDWNSDFERDRNVHKIEGFIGIDLVIKNFF